MFLEKNPSATRSLFCAALTLCCLTPVCATATPGTLSPQVAGEMQSQIRQVLVQRDKTTAFSADYLEARFGLPGGEIEAVTIAALPSGEKGALLLDGVPVERYDVLLRHEVDRLCYLPDPDSTQVESWFSFISLSSKSVCATVQLRSTPVPNHLPVLKNVFRITNENTSFSQKAICYDANGDPLSLQLKSRPKKGRVTISGQTYTYTPFPGKTGQDHFSLVVADTRGGISNTATVTLSITPDSAE